MSDLVGFKDAVKDSVDLRDVFQEDGVKFTRASGDSAKCCCPFHEENTPSCHVHGEYFNCFGCGEKGDHFDYLMKRHTMDFMEALRYLAEMAKMQMPEVDPVRAKEAAEKRERQHTIYEVLEKIQKWYVKNLQSLSSVQAYCKDRGLTEDDLETWGIGFALETGQPTKDWAQNEGINEELMVDAGLFGSSSRQKEHGNKYLYPRFQGRLMFPIYDHRSRLCGFSGRIIDPEAKTAKYLNTSETEVFKKSELIYGLNVAANAIAKGRKVVLVEGQLDVIACHRAGLGNTVACLGTAFGDDHRKLLEKFADELTIMLDGDEPGLKATRKVIEEFLTNEDEG